MTTKRIEEVLYKYCKRKGVKLIALNINYLYPVISHEIDFMFISKANYLTEIEIKISKSDLKADFKKRHKHPIGFARYRLNSNGELDELPFADGITIKQQYFAIPHTLEDCIDLIPNHFGVLLIYPSGKIKRVRLARNNKARQLTESEILHFAILQSNKYWYRRLNPRYNKTEYKN